MFLVLAGTGLVVDADPARISQVLLNILNNAVKFTPPGGHIRLSAGRLGDLAEIRVRDDGAGIPREMLPRVFDMFMQVDGARDRSHGGLGIGLNIVRTLVQMHGATVTAHSDGAGCGPSSWCACRWRPTEPAGNPYCRCFTYML